MKNRFVSRGSHGAMREAVATGPAERSHLLRLGGRLRHARLLQGYSLREVATFAGVSESYVSKLENNKLQPSLSTLHRLANALNTNIAALVAETSEADGPAVIVTPGQRPSIEVAGDGDSKSIVLQGLIPAASGNLLQANIHVIEPGAEEDFIQHGGQEFGFVLEGQLLLKVDDRTFCLGPGDAFSFWSDHSHGYRNVSDRPTRVLWVNTPPTF